MQGFLKIAIRKLQQQIYNRGNLSPLFWLILKKKIDFNQNYFCRLKKCIHIQMTIFQQLSKKENISLVGVKFFFTTPTPTKWLVSTTTNLCLFDICLIKIRCILQSCHLLTYIRTYFKHLQKVLKRLLSEVTLDLKFPF